MSRRQEQDGVIGLLQRIFTDQPKLAEPACSSRHELFDPAAPGEPAEQSEARHERAAALCARCPALDDCTEYAAGERWHGAVIAGQVRR